MRKVMLVIDDVQNLRGLEAFLRRLGFDVLSLGREALVNDALLGFPAEVAIVSDKGRHIDGLRLAQRLRKQTPPPRVAICYSGPPPQYAKEDLKAVDAFMEIPATGENAVLLISQLAGLAPEPLLEKFKRTGVVKGSDEEKVVVTGSAKPRERTTVHGSDVETERSQRYAQFLENHAADLQTVPPVLPRERAKQLMKKLKDDAVSEKDQLDAINAEKVKFVEALMDEGADDKESE